MATGSKKITVLFGAGADALFSLSTGHNFATSVLGLENEEMNDAIRSFYREFPETKWCPSYHKSNSFKKEDLLIASIKRMIVEQEGYYSTKKEFESRVNEVRNSYDTEEAMDKCIHQFTSYIGILDECFHTLIEPRKLGSSKFWKVIECMTRAYLLMVEELCSGDRHQWNENEYLDVLYHPLATKERVKRAIVEDSRYHVKNYYSILKGRNDVNVISTNYTPCCDIVSERRNIIHVHGRLDQFEIPYEWRVCNEIEAQHLVEKKLFFPYLSIQSGVKPIVEENQINEYSRMVKAMKTDKLIILGYGINYDDNHINSVIRSAYIKHKEIVYFNYDSDESASNMKEIVEKRLHIDKSQGNLRVVNINKANCVDLFQHEVGY